MMSRHSVTHKFFGDGRVLMPVFDHLIGRFEASVVDFSNMMIIDVKVLANQRTVTEKFVLSIVPN